MTRSKTLIFYLGFLLVLLGLLPLFNLFGVLAGVRDNVALLAIVLLRAAPIPA